MSSIFICASDLSSEVTDRTLTWRFVIISNDVTYGLSYSNAVAHTKSELFEKQQFYRISEQTAGEMPYFDSGIAYLY